MAAVGQQCQCDGGGKVTSVKRLSSRWESLSYQVGYAGKGTNPIGRAKGLANEK